MQETHDTSVFIEADLDHPEVQAILETHLEFARRVTPAGHVHALDAGGLAAPDVTVYALLLDESVVAIGAIRELSPVHGEIKSMHTVERARQKGLGKRLAVELLAEAQRRGYGQVSLETGTMQAFEPARRLYVGLGFEECEPFGDYQPVPNSVCMTLFLEPD